MKVIILTNLFPPNARGGAEYVAKNQATELASEGNEVCVVTLSPSNEYRAQKWKNKKIYYLPHKNLFNYSDINKKPAWLRFIWHIIDTFNFWLANDIKEILESEKPDLVIMHNMKGLSLLTPYKIQNTRYKIHLIIHDVSFYTPSGLIEYGKENSWEHKGFLTKIYRFFTRRLFSYPEKIFFPSAWLLNFYRKNGFFIKQEKIHKPNIVNFENQLQGEERSGFLYVGQLEKHKGILLLLDAFDAICRDTEFRVPTLNIVGDGSLMPEIKKRAENNPNIKIHGKLPQEKLPEFYARTKAVIVPSIVYENAPNVIHEALACNTPVIVSRIGGAYEPIREGENGHIFEPGNIEELYQKMKLF